MFKKNTHEKMLLLVKTGDKKTILTLLTLFLKGMQMCKTGARKFCPIVISRWCIFVFLAKLCHDF